MEKPPFPPPGFVPGPSQVAGIQVFVPASQAIDRPDVVDFKCPQCGATIAYCVSQGSLTCQHCGHSEVPDAETLGNRAEQFEFKVETLLRSQSGWGVERKELACQRCGGVVSVPPDILTYSCPFCDSNKVLYREPLEDVLRPRALIPFKIDPATCREITQKWLGNSWMLPAELREARIEKFHPLYIPYWTFDAVCKATWRAQTIKAAAVIFEMENPVIPQHHTETGKVRKEFSNLLVPGTSRLNMKALGSVDAFSISDLVLYEPAYLAGMQAQAYDLPLEEAWKIGRKIMRDRTRLACIDQISASTIKSFRMHLDFGQEAWRYILVPIYTNNYRYGEHTYQILVNGQNGRIAGPRPVDWRKVWLVIAAVLAPGALAAIVGLWLGNSETGVLTTGVGMLLMLIAVVFAFFTIRQALELEHD